METAKRNLLPDIRDMLALSMSPPEASRWLATENSALGKRTPVACMAAGEFQQVYSAVLHLGPQT